MEDDSDKTKSINKNDASYLFFIHHSDHPGIILVSKPLNGDNYGTWSRSMKISLSAKNKLGFIDGSVQVPCQIKSPEEYSSWKRCKDMILSWILNSLEPDIADSVIYSTTSHGIWKDLEERFSQSNAPRIFQLQREMAYLQQNEMSISAYYTKLKGLWDELVSYNEPCHCTCGKMKPQSEREERNALMQFLMGLNESYSVVRGKILLMQPLPSHRKAYSLIFQEEKQRELGNTRGISEVAAMAVQRGQRTSKSGRKPPYCSHCDKDFHTKEMCYKLHNYPEGHRLHKSSNGGHHRK